MNWNVGQIAFARVPRAIQRCVLGLLICLGGSNVFAQSSWPVNAPILLLGEVHDNAAGHQARLEDLKLYRAQNPNWRPVLIMEQFTRDQTLALQRALAVCITADCLIQKVGQTGWDWPLYQPLLQWALDEGLSVWAGDLPSAEVRLLATGSSLNAVLGAEVLKPWSVQSLPQDYTDAVAQRIVQGHCNLLPLQVAKGMLPSQTGRDVWMAHQLLSARAQGQPAVLIAGNGHIDLQWGVGYWLGLLGSQSVHAVAYVEESQGQSGIQAHTLRQVPQQPRPDPCEELRQHFRRKAPAS